ncbi:MAG: hypothetical protein BWY74_03380 [Firmicutes bacterium ADurb.Bin419]|nr:MAG: hypothetical protein BWY74_03380 [Firmicutes bacterium ADurb.Bin419]
MSFFIVTIILIFVFLILCLIKINVAMEYNRQGVNDHFVLSFFIFNGLVKYKYELPRLDAGKKGIRFRKIKKKGKKEKDVSNKKDKTSYGDIISKIEMFRSFRKKYNILIGHIYKYLKCRLSIKKLDINISFGTDNAHHTAVLTGLCWSAVGLLVSFLHNKLNIVEKSINIKPDYMGKKFKVDLFCILSMRVGHIIIVGLIILIHIIRNKFGFIELRRSVAG